MRGETQLPTALFLLGPTASGKTDIAVSLAARFPVEIVSVDSGMVYRGLDIGTAKPDAVTLARAPHHLIDLVDPGDAYSAGRFRRDALRVMTEITARGRVPLLVGGTMLYFKALRDGLAEMPEADPAIRAGIDARAAREGWPALHAELARLDAESAAALSPNDSQRIQRALEIVLTTGRPRSHHWAEARAALPYRVTALALLPEDRARLHARIERRFAAMLDAGLIDEVRGLRQRFVLHADLPSMRCVGYRQVWQHLEGEFGPAELYERGVIATRQLARRQFTWLRAMHELVPFDPFADGAAPAIAAAIERVLT